MIDYIAAEKMLREKTKKDLLSLFRKTLTIVSVLKFTNISVELSVNFNNNDELALEVTVFNLKFLQ